MQISSRFTIGVHTLLLIGMYQDKDKITSEYIAGSVRVNPVIIRNILGQLKRANLVQITRGSGGARLTRPLEEITLLDIYLGVEAIGKDKLFHFHQRPNPDCPVGKVIHGVLDERLDYIQKTLENSLAQMTMADVLQDSKRLIGIDEI